MNPETVEFGNISAGPEDRMLLERIKDIYRRISSAVIRSGRNPFDVKLVAATKRVPVEKIKTAADLGLRVFGENMVQEAREKIVACRSQCPGYAIEWHMIGHLQKNKAKAAVQLFEMIHSLDSRALAVLLDRYAGETGKIQRVLIEVKLSPETTKYGVAREDLMSLVELVSEMKNLKLEGFMTVPPFSGNPGAARPYFRNLRYLRDEAEKLGIKLPELSMGMTNDYEAAILEGATMVRIGTGIFGERKYV